MVYYDSGILSPTGTVKNKNNSTPGPPARCNCPHEEMRIQMRLATILFLVSVILRPQAAPPPGQTSSPKAEEEVKQLLSSIPQASEWRKMMENGLRGNGIRHPWMDKMTRVAPIRTVSTRCQGIGEE